MKRGAMGAAAGASSARFLLSSPPRSLLPLSVGCYQDLTRRESEGVWRLSRPSPSPTDPPRSGPSVTQTDAARCRRHRLRRNVGAAEVRGEGLLVFVVDEGLWGAAGDFCLP